MAKANSYKLKNNVTERDLLDLGFKKGSWRGCDKGLDVVSKMVNLYGSIDLSIFVKTNPVSFDDFNDTEVIDFDFGQPYTPFYGKNYKKDVVDFEFLEAVVDRYNQAMDIEGIFERL